MDQLLKEAASVTPDPERALKNLNSFIEENPDHAERLRLNTRAAAQLFSHSQFLANYSISNPDDLFNAIANMEAPLVRESTASSLKKDIEALDLRPLRDNLPVFMNTVRRFRLREFLKITLRDTMRKADLIEIMSEMSMLADVIIAASLEIVRDLLHDIYGSPEDEQFSVISLGKLGAEELNYSSDVDFIYVYGTEIGETSGVLTPQGTRKNRITNHEYYCKAGEELAKFLSQNTEAGFAYRVDMRLRPEGQKGALALALRGYEMYYESWGRAWERAMLLRARPVAGEEKLGAQFMEMIRPFVFRKYLDFSAIEEISKLKTRIDATFKKNDIKRGVGGIREIEFFAQALQLIYAGKEPILRERSTFKALHRLLQKGLIGQEDYGALSDNYRYLRTLEHRLQQVNDLQTHLVPSGDAELSSLAHKMGFGSRASFVSDLDHRRQRVRTIYNSLFGKTDGEPSQGSAFFDEEYSDAELKEVLAGSGIKDVDRAFRNIRSIRDSIFNFQTLRGRRLLSEILPVFVETGIRSSSPDNALNHLQAFAVLLSTNESYLDLFSRNRELIDLIISVFAQSNYLSKMLMARPENLEMMGWQNIISKSMAGLRKELLNMFTDGYSVSDAIRLMKQAEEMRLGLLFLHKRIDIVRLTHGLARTAEAILKASSESIVNGQPDFAVIGFGKLGGREINFGSDLDLIFACTDDPDIETTKNCEKMLRLLISYTRNGAAYSVDTRLRPEGSKGPLVSSVEAFRKYYTGSAAFWEFQALLKARPVAGDRRTGLRFMQTAHDALRCGDSVSAADIRQMREKIMRERLKESEGYDIKLGFGGMEEIEFIVQYLQLKNAKIHQGLLVQNTLSALHRIERAGLIPAQDCKTLADVYIFYRTIESLLRLRGEGVLKRDDAIMGPVAAFLGEKDLECLGKRIETSRNSVMDISERYLRDS